MKNKKKELPIGTKVRILKKNIYGTWHDSQWVWDTFKDEILTIIRYDSDGYVLLRSPNPPGGSSWWTQEDLIVASLDYRKNLVGTDNAI